MEKSCVTWPKVRHLRRPRSPWTPCAALRFRRDGHGFARGRGAAGLGHSPLLPGADRTACGRADPRLRLSTPRAGQGERPPDRSPREAAAGAAGCDRDHFRHVAPPEADSGSGVRRGRRHREDSAVAVGALHGQEPGTSADTGWRGEEEGARFGDRRRNVNAVQRSARRCGPLCRSEGPHRENWPAFPSLRVVRADGHRSPAGLRPAVPTGGRRSKPVPALFPGGGTRISLPCGERCRSEGPTGRNPHDRVLLHTPPVMKKVWHSRWRGAASSALVSRSRAMPVGDRRSAVAFHLRGGRYASFAARRAAVLASSPGRGLKTGGPFPPRHPAD